MVIIKFIVRSMAAIIAALWAILCVSCNFDHRMVTPADRSVKEEVVTFLESNWDLLPEKAISVSVDSSVFAVYAGPTSRYQHGILGDAIEGTRLVVVIDSFSYEVALDNHLVFEDICPRIADVNDDGRVDFITIRTHLQKGAGIAIYTIENQALTLYAQVEEIGTPYRWLNIIDIRDLNGDGTTDVAWVETPHIGGVLKVGSVGPGQIVPYADTTGFSNHAIGERNLCLSVVTIVNHVTTVYVPTQDRMTIAGFTFQGNTLRLAETIPFSVDFSLPLGSQYAFEGVLGTQACCGCPLVADQHY